MTDVVFINPSDVEPLDSTKIRRSQDGRPYVKCPCSGACDGTGQVPSEKRPGKVVQCPTCKGKGQKDVLMTRCTSFVGVLDDRSALEKWQKRIVLKGLTNDGALLDTLGDLDTDDDKALNEMAGRAFEAGDGYEKARKGTDLHKLSEFVDAGHLTPEGTWVGEPFPEELWNEDAQAFRPVTLQDRADMAAYVRIRDDLGLVYLDRELFVVNDEYRIGGTFDGLTAEAWKMDEDGKQLSVCPVGCERPVIVDLKTGRTDYGQGKMAQQLAVYSRSSRYDPATGDRTPLEACPHVGIILALPQGSGDASVLLLDLERGWSAVSLSAQVREHRREVARGEFVLGSTCS